MIDRTRIATTRRHRLLIPCASAAFVTLATFGTYFSDVQGVGINASDNASITFNDSEAHWRTQQWVGAAYSHQSQPVPGTSDTASISFKGANANSVLSWDMSDDSRWTFGLLLAAEKNPQANYALRANASVGIELDWIPRQTVNQKNFGLRCAVGPELQKYDEMNVDGLTQQTVAREFCDVYMNWHFRPIDIWASVGETALVEAPTFRSFSVGLAVTWRLTDNLTISPWVNAQQIHRAPNEVAQTTTVYDDPKDEIEASMRAAIEQSYTAPFGVQSGLSIRYLFGNGSLSSEDQRWRGTSNLR
ncbi:MAG: hypothetical protein ACHREM_25820 [Polyangiales bacterium]